MCRRGASQVVEDAEEITDFDFPDHMMGVGTELTDPYQNLLATAIKNEAISLKLYIELAALCKDESLREVFLALAEEEARHKVQFEMEYEHLKQ